MLVTYTGKFPTATTSRKKATASNTLAWQRYLNWYYGKKVLEEDGEFGPKTEKKTVAFQKKVFPNKKEEWDGIVGPKTLKKAKAATKTVADKNTSATGMYTGTFPSFTSLGGDILSATTIKLAWGYGTKKEKYAYPNGKPKEAFVKAINEVYPNRSSWGAQTKRGASCDVFVGVCARYSGVDKKFPRGLDGNPQHFNKNKDKWRKVNVHKAKDFRPGDVIYQLYKGGGGHICIYVEKGGQGYIAEAGYNSKRYGVLARKARNYTPSAYKTFLVYRPVGSPRQYLMKGDISVQVKYLQKFLNWCMKSNLDADGVYGSKTETIVKMFQTKYKLEVDGKFGAECLKKAKVVVVK